MKKYYCSICGIEVSNDELERTGESEIKSVDQEGKLGAGMIYRHSKCGTEVREASVENEN